MNPIAKRAQRVPGWLRAPFVLIPLALTAYWSFTYTGLYRLLAEWQLSAFGGYQVILTGLVVMIITLMPAVVGIQLVAGLFPEPNEAGRDPEELDRLIRSNIGWVFGGILFVGTLGAALLFSVMALQAGGERTDITAATLEAGGGPKHQHVRLSGIALRSRALVTESTTNGSTKIRKLYVPMVSKASAQPVVYVELHASLLKHKPKALSGPLEGLLTRGTLPGMLVSQLEAEGDQAAAKHWVLALGKTPSSWWVLAQAFWAVSIVVALALAAAYAVRRRRLKTL